MKMCVKSRKLTMVLANEILKELQQVLNRESSSSAGDELKDVSPEELAHHMDIRLACLHYIRSAHVTFHTQPETFAVAVRLLDVVLWKFKVTQRLMSIIGVACYVIAAKIVEEDEHTPTPQQLAQCRGHDWTSRDLCRMELYILKRLTWTPPRVTYVSYLPALCRLFQVNPSHLHADRTALLAERCLKQVSTVLLPPPDLALALVLHLAGNPDDSFTQEKIKQVMNVCKISESKLAQCSEVLSSISSSVHTTVLKSRIRSIKTKKASFPIKVFTKPSESGSPDLATILECMNED